MFPTFLPSFQNQRFLETSITRFSSFFFFKVKYLRHLLSKHATFLVSLPMVCIYKFCEKDIMIQPPGEPRDRHLGEVRTK